VAVQVAVCRTLTVTRDGVELRGPSLGTRKARVLVAVLAAARGSAVASDRLAEILWGDDLPRDPPANLATLASRLRRSVGEEMVIASASSYALRDDVPLDVDVARRLVRGAATRLSRSEHGLAASSASRALEVLGADDTLAEECGGDWAENLRREAADLRREARHLAVLAAAATGGSEGAMTAAAAAVEADPYDERAHRDLMQLLVADGRTAAALDAYAALAARLADDLGTDPDPETQRLHLALLRAEKPTASRSTTSTGAEGVLVGREDEVRALDEAWARAGAGHSRLVLVTGVAGIGKTRLLEESARLAEEGGGLVLAVRCHLGERSLFLEPYVEALRPVLLGLVGDRLRDLITGHEAAWAWLMPDLVPVLSDTASTTTVSPDLARRRAYDAVAAALVGLAAERPLLLSVDDLQDGATATTELLSYLGRRLAGARVLLVGVARSDATDVVHRLGRVDQRIDLGPLPVSAVNELAEAAGHGRHTEDVQARTSGHTLSVVETLRALSSGIGGVPDTLSSAVAGQLDALEPAVRRIVEGASVLGSRVEPHTLAALAGTDELTCAEACDRLTRTGLLTARGREYEFSNDLLRDAVVESLPPAVATAYHRRAADLVADRPEVMAVHAFAAGDHDRAARGWLVAGRTARHRTAFEDAVALLDRALAAAEDPALRSEIRINRSRAHEATAAYDLALADGHAALEEAQQDRNPRLEMRALRVRCGDAVIALRRPLDEVMDDNTRGMGLAARLGDRVAESWFRARLVVLEASRLRLTEASDRATRGVLDMRGVGSPEALALSLDGLKTVHAYCGDAGHLEQVVAELGPLLADLRLDWLLQWMVLESALVPAARGRWSEARARVDRALELNRETGYTAYAGYFRSQRGWLARLAGDLEAALEDGRRAVDETSAVDHPWWYATAAGCHASTLLEAGRPDEAAAVAAQGLGAVPEAGESYRLRCLAPLAAATGEGLDEADRLLAAVRTPPGQGWVAGADVYDAVGAAWLAAGEPHRARAASAPLLDATGPGSWATVHARLVQRSSASS
jgi:DNA-binding SARP family transcriptional activator/tetratricopeptide (TPR) repeat protein